MNLAAQLEQSKHAELIETLLSHPKFKQLLHAQISLFQQQNKKVQIGSGVSNIMNEIYESIQTITNLKLKQMLHDQGYEWMGQGSKLKKQVEQMRDQIADLSKNKEPIKFDVVANNEFEKLMTEERSILTEVLPCGSEEFTRLREELDQLKTSVGSLLRTQPSSEKLIPLNPEMQSPLAGPTNKSTILGRRAQTDFELFPTSRSSATKFECFSKQFQFLVKENENIKEKLEKYQIDVLNKYENRFSSIMKALKKMDEEVWELKKDDKVVNRKEPSKSFVSRASNKSGFSALLNWK